MINFEYRLRIMMARASDSLVTQVKPISSPPRPRHDSAILIERAFGKNATTRTLETVSKCAAA
jgi:hypothetical protein